ncbi:protein MEI2-like 6 [Phragmites australis]|uniref:protein MEI2-like 6 n=1 Tax=Phragmites australis TaxID=29695 RepID=UPI002D77D385|nr:protein MEI2-like 6 [Phragmites australis]
MASSVPSNLRPDAPVYVPLAFPIGPPPVAPGLELYVEALPPRGFVPTSSALPFLSPPPPLPFADPGFCGFPAQGLGMGMGMQGAFPHPPWATPMGMAMPLGALAMPVSPAGMHFSPHLQQPRITAAPQDGGHRPRSSMRIRRAPSTRRRRPRPVVTLRRKGSPHPEPTPSSRSTEVSGNGGNGVAKVEPANEPSPRSVLDTTSPPDSPPVVLPASFPYLDPSPPSSPAPTGLAPGTEPSRRSVPPSGSPRVPPPPRPRKPRRLFNPASNRTSLMIRNIPNNFTRKNIMNIIDQHCAEENAKVTSGGGGVKSEYDFLYVPIDFRTKFNKGYAFVNVTTPDAAHRLWAHLHRHRWTVGACQKICEVDLAVIQGRHKLVEHFSGSRFDCDTEDFLPVWFQPPRDGTRPTVGVQHVVGNLARRL